jgi:hypothetical protein
MHNAKKEEKKRRKKKKETARRCPHRNLDFSSYIIPFDSDYRDGCLVVYDGVKWDISNQEVSKKVMCRLDNTLVFSYRVMRLHSIE